MPIKPSELPDKSSPDYFRFLVKKCIETYRELPNDSMCLDRNKVTGKLRAMVLDDVEYRGETRSIYAEQTLEELKEIDNLTRMTVDDEDDYDPRSKGKKKKITTADKDILNMRLKAVQLRRDIIADLNEKNSGTERDAVAFMYVAFTREELERDVHNELSGGQSEATDVLEELTSRKEEAPEGSSGKIRNPGQTKRLGDEDIFDVLPSGEIVEK